MATGLPLLAKFQSRLTTNPQAVCRTSRYWPLCDESPSEVLQPVKSGHLEL
jgi:hypothetical protein